MKKSVFIILLLSILESTANAHHRTTKRKNTKKSIPAATLPSAKATNGTIETITVNGVSFNMIFVEGGTFNMGASDKLKAYDNERPAHQVTLSNYWIGETEVTEGLWKAVMGKLPHPGIGGMLIQGDNYPVKCVSWNDAQEFLTTLNALTGKTFTLPTEAQWEFAARGGNKSWDYVFSGSYFNDEVGWMSDNSGGAAHEVAQLKANELGIYDMSGNVSELCSDWYGKYYDSVSPLINPIGPPSGPHKVIRGGGWNSDADQCRVSFRLEDPGFNPTIIGLRLAL